MTRIDRALRIDNTKDGHIDEHDLPRLFRLALGDTTARRVVAESTIARIEAVAFE